MKRICVSVCAESLESLKSKLALFDADLVEVRLDCLKNLEEEEIARWLANTKKCLLFTYRSKEQGGNREFDQGLWNHILSKLAESKLENFLVDWEYDLPTEKASFPFKRIISFHSFSTGAVGVQEVYKQMSQKGEVLKIAVMVDDAVDAIEIWKLLEDARRDGKKLIPIAMGEAGKWTRILGLAYGAYLTFASLDENEATAPGQISFSEMQQVYRAEELTKGTAIYGLLAGNTAYSLSPYIHNFAFKHNQVEAVFVPFQTKDLDRFLTEMVFEKKARLNFKGFAVTNPYKEKIVAYLDEVDQIAQKIGAVNTVKIENGKLKGYNTDVEGFIKPLVELYGSLRGVRVAVIGTGGAASACVFALKEKGASVTTFSRSFEKAKSFAERFGISFSEFLKDKTSFDEFDILVNATPIGTKGYCEESMITAEQIRHLHLVYDIVYNPLDTELLKEARKANVAGIGGLQMLVNQAAKQQEIWTGKEAPIKQMTQIAMNRLSS